MLYLNLDPNFKPFSWGTSDISHESFIFSGGEVHIKLKDFLPHEEVTIVHRVNSSADLMKVVMANDALQRAGHKEISLYMPYLPYARQDRVMTKGEPLSIKVFTQIINSCNFKRVTILDPHSDAGPALLDQVEIIPNYTFVSIAFGRLSTDFGIDMSEVVVVSPDAGAYKKIFKTCENVGFKGGLVLCNKVRNLSTNEIIKISFDGDVEGKNCVIIDDICDGGRTFIELGKQLKEKGASRVFLFVTHGIFLYGEEPLMGTIDHVYTTRSFRDFDGFKIVTSLESI